MWHTGNQWGRSLYRWLSIALGENKNEVDEDYVKGGGIIVGFLASAFAIASIAAIYAVLFPLIAKLVAVHIMPLLSPHAPFAPVPETTIKFMDFLKIMGDAGWALTKHVSFLTHIPGVSAIVMAAPEMIGAGFMAGLSASILGPVLNVLTGAFTSWWHRGETEGFQKEAFERRSAGSTSSFSDEGSDKDHKDSPSYNSVFSAPPDHSSRSNTHSSTSSLSYNSGSESD